MLASFVVGPNPMALVFNGYELGGLLFAVLIANLVTQEGESNSFEGVQLLSLYTVLGLVFYSRSAANVARAMRSSTRRSTLRRVSQGRWRQGSLGRPPGPRYAEPV
jgi:hypothetical protein